MNESRVRKSPAVAPEIVNAAVTLAVKAVPVNKAAQPTGLAPTKSAGNAAAKPPGNSTAKAPRSNPKAESSAAIWRWVATRQRHVQLSTYLPTAKKSLELCIKDYTTELTKLITALPHPIDFLQRMPWESLLNCGHAINREAQFVDIRKYAADRNLSAKIRELRSG